MKTLNVKQKDLDTDPKCVLNFINTCYNTKDNFTLAIGQGKVIPSSYSNINGISVNGDFELFRDELIDLENMTNVTKDQNVYLH